MRLKWVNRLLLTAIIVINLYIIVAPLLPGLLFWLKQQDSSQTTKLQDIIKNDKPISKDNRIVIPSMLYDQKVFSGESVSTLNKGAWRVPYTSTPDKGGNTVIIAHRYTYEHPETSFYHLDKVKVGDEIGLFWNKKEYIYKVREIKEVPPTAIEIEGPSSDPILTLYTCTPLWNSANRLVVIADLEES